jgi:hypothetical protein
MVWHTHMLNPRAFLEDCILAGLRTFWITGMPWDLINKAIDVDFNYIVSEQCKARWTEVTGMPWDSADGPVNKELPCPRKGCRATLHIPWTTCGYAEDSSIDEGPPDLAGHGYGDSTLKYTCSQCRLNITRDVLSVARFVRDVEGLHNASRPMPGTILSGLHGRPLPYGNELKGTKPAAKSPQTFPNRLLKSHCANISTKVTSLLQPVPLTGPNTKLNMDTIRSMMDVVIGSKHSAYIKIIEGRKHGYGLSRDSRLAIRLMMSRYWENFTPFALDLAGGIMRQGTFVEKMCSIDWLHSPTARETMSRLIEKYKRFVSIMVKHPQKMVVPTLDVDLAWHTHQLTPSQYYTYTVGCTGRFVDHNDKVEEDKLGRQFKWTSKIYQEMYREPYSECTCWYCEGESLVLRASHLARSMLINAVI